MPNLQFECNFSLRFNFSLPVTDTALVLMKYLFYILFAICQRSFYLCINQPYKKEYSGKQKANAEY